MHNQATIARCEHARLMPPEQAYPEIIEFTEQEQVRAEYVIGRLYQAFLYRAAKTHDRACVIEQINDAVEALADAIVSFEALVAEESGRAIRGGVI